MNVINLKILASKINFTFEVYKGNGKYGRNADAIAEGVLKAVLMGESPNIINQITEKGERLTDEEYRLIQDAKRKVEDIYDELRYILDISNKVGISENHRFF